MGASELRARWWLLACACALTAQDAAARGQKPYFSYAQCAWWLHPSCRNTSNPEVFIIYGQQHRITYLDSDTFDTSCTAANLDENVWPYFSRATQFDTVILRNCTPPQAYTSYASALLSINVTATKSFRLLDVPSNAIITAQSLEGMPSNIEIGTVLGSVLTLPSNALEGLKGVTTLKLLRVNFDQLPSNLTNLSVLGMNSTGFKTERLANVTGDLMVITESMRNLSIDVPLAKSLRIVSPSLYLLGIANASVDAMKPGFLHGCTDLNAVLLRTVRGYRLPQGLLTGLAWLGEFLLLDSEIVRVPYDLFLHSPRMVSTRMTNNRLISLPDLLFSGQDKMFDVNLSNNRIDFLELKTFAPLVSLRNLDISGNPLMTLCPDTSESLLPTIDIREFYLSHANLTHICLDWLRDFRRLFKLDLSYNEITSLNCSEIHILRSPGHLGSATINMTGNPITQYNCSKADFHTNLKEPVIRQVVTLVVPQLTCDCGGYWFNRTLAAHHIIIKQDRVATCGYLWKRCA